MAQKFQQFCKRSLCGVFPWKRVFFVCVVFAVSVTKTTAFLFFCFVFLLCPCVCPAGGLHLFVLAPCGMMFVLAPCGMMYFWMLPPPSASLMNNLTQECCIWVC